MRKIIAMVFLLAGVAFGQTNMGPVKISGGTTINNSSDVAQTNQANNFVPRQGFKNLEDIQFADSFGATSTNGIAEAIAALTNGGTVILPYGTVTNTACIPLKNNLKLQGHAGSGTGASPYPSWIKNGTTDIFCNPNSALQGVELTGFTAESTAGGGHVFNFSANAQATSHIDVHDVLAIEDNTGKSVVNNTQSAGGNCFFGTVKFHEFYFQYPASTTVPAVNIVCNSPNGIIFENGRSTGGNTSAGTYAFWIENNTNNAAGIGNRIRDWTFEIPGGGAAAFRSLYQSGIENSGVWDLSVVPNNPLFSFDKSTTSGRSGQQEWVRGITSNFGTAGVPDLQVNMNGGVSPAFSIQDSFFAWVDGISEASAQTPISVINSTILHTEHYAFTSIGSQLNGSSAARNGICFDNSQVAGGNNVCAAGGQTGFNNGYLVFSVNGVDEGGINNGGQFYWGTSPTVIGTGGAINTPQPITSTLATGTQPFVIASTTPVPNLSLAGGAGSSVKTALYFLNNVYLTATAPTITSGFGTSPTIPASNGSGAFTLNVGTGGTATSGVVNLNGTAANGWICSVANQTAHAGHRADDTVQNSSTTTTVTIENQTKSTGAAVAWTASDILTLKCEAY